MVAINDLALFGVDVIRSIMYDNAPYDKGNLRDNGISLAESVDNKCAQIVINRGNAAPYAIILDEARYIKIARTDSYYVNRHYNWVYQCVIQGAMKFASYIGGEVTSWG